MTKHQDHPEDRDDDLLRVQMLCIACSGSLCYRHRFLLRKLLLNKLWGQVGYRFNKWRSFCTRSSVLLDRLLVVEQRHRRWRAFAHWKRIVRSQQLSEQAEAFLIVRRSRQAAKKLDRMVAKHDIQFLVSAWVDWRSWHRRRRCALFQRGAHFQFRRRFQHWKAMARQAKTLWIPREQLIREMLFEVVNSSIAMAEIRSAAAVNTANKKRLADALSKCFNGVRQVHQRQELARRWRHWYLVSKQRPLRKESSPPSDGKWLKNQPEKLRHPQRVARKYRNESSTRVKARKLPRPAWR